MISRLQQLCVQSSRTPVSLPKVLSDPADPWRILQQRAKNTVYSDDTFKMKGARLKTQRSACRRERREGGSDSLRDCLLGKSDVTWNDRKLPAEGFWL